MRLSFVVLGALMAVSPSVAEACTAPPLCQGSAVYPQPGMVPANGAFEWWMTDARGALPPVTLRLVDAAGVEVPSMITVGLDGPARIAPRAPLPVGSRVAIVSSDMRCADLLSPSGVTRIEYTVGEARPVPTTLGTLSATTPTLATIQYGPYTGSECAASGTAVMATVSVTLSPEATQWSSSLVYEALVDGVPYVGWPLRGYPMAPVTPGATWAGRGQVHLARICSPAGAGAGLSEGEHEAVFRARLAGTDTVLRTDPIRVTLRCPTATPDAGMMGPPAGDAGAFVPPDGGPMRPAPDVPSPSDGGTTSPPTDAARPVDAVTSTDAATTADSGSTRPPPDASTDPIADASTDVSTDAPAGSGSDGGVGCSCATPGQSTRGWAWLPVALALAFVRRRSRAA